MPGAIFKQPIGEIAQSKTKGKAFLAEIGAKLANQDAIAREVPKTQPIKQGDKK